MDSGVMNIQSFYRFFGECEQQRQGVRLETLFSAKARDDSNLFSNKHVLLLIPFPVGDDDD